MLPAYPSTHPLGQTDVCENITFPQLRNNIIYFFYWTTFCSNYQHSEICNSVTGIVVITSTEGVETLTLAVCNGVMGTVITVTGSAARFFTDSQQECLGLSEALLHNTRILQQKVDCFYGTFTQTNSGSRISQRGMRQPILALMVEKRNRGFMKKIIMLGKLLHIFTVGK